MGLMQCLGDTQLTPPANFIVRLFSVKTVSNIPRVTCQEETTITITLHCDPVKEESQMNHKFLSAGRDLKLIWTGMKEF